MDRVLKVIYDHCYSGARGNMSYLLNGVHPAVITYIMNHSGNDIDLDTLKNDIQTYNTESSWSCFFRHANFLGYYNKHFKNKNIVKIDEIQDDDAIYLLPIEVGGSLGDFVQSHKLTIENNTYEYTFIDTIDPRLIPKLQSGQVKLLINIIHDPIVNANAIEDIETYFNQYGIDGSNIIILGGNEFLEYYHKKPNSKIKLTYGYIMVQQAGDRLDNFPYMSSLGYISDAVKEEDLDITKIRPKKFICWNRTMRVHRYWLAYLATKYNLLENSYFSFLNPGGGEASSVGARLMSYLNDQEEANRYAEPIYNLIPLELDTQHLSRNQKSGFSTNNNKKEFYENSYIHITSETLFEEEITSTPFFSEKTFHAMVNLQPFVYVGCYGALRKLKEWGIKTFHPYIDESYDDEQDPVKRFKLIENEIRKLNEKSIEEIHEWYYSIKDVLLHNQQQLKNFSPMNPFENGFNDIQKFYSK